MTSKKLSHETNFNILKQYLDEDFKNKKSGYEKVIEDKNIHIYKKNLGSYNILMLRIQILFKSMSLDIINNMLIDLNLRKKWDKQFINHKIIEVISTNEDIIYYEIKSPSLVNNRDFIQYRTYINNQDNIDLITKYGLWQKSTKYYLSYSKSINRPDIPEKKGIIRGDTILNGWLIEQDTKNPNDTLMNIILHIDIRGDIPIWFYNKIILKYPMVFMEELNHNYKIYQKHIEHNIQLQQGTKNHKEDIVEIDVLKTEESTFVINYKHIDHVYTKPNSHIKDNNSCGGGINNNVIEEMITLEPNIIIDKNNNGDFNNDDLNNDDNDLTIFEELPKNIKDLPIATKITPFGEDDNEENMFFKQNKESIKISNDINKNKEDLINLKLEDAINIIKHVKQIDDFNEIQ